mmetsp:Transcript_80107/g.258921  ORF Transcript_80107/g.258921 Transcript_80107/m.258921 type:complete len:460 (-) Transcript_80107:356-1735(-)
MYPTLREPTTECHILKACNSAPFRIHNGNTSSSLFFRVLILLLFFLFLLLLSPQRLWVGHLDDDLAIVGAGEEGLECRRPILNPLGHGLRRFELPALQIAVHVAEEGTLLARQPAAAHEAFDADLWINQIPDEELAEIASNAALFATFVVLRDAATHCDSTTWLHARQRGIEVDATDVLEVHVDAFRSAFLQLGLQLLGCGAGLVINCVVVAEFLLQHRALRRSSGTADDDATRELGELADQLADCTAGGTHEDRLTVRLALRLRALRLQDVKEAAVGRGPGHAEDADAQGGRRFCDESCQLPRNRPLQHFLRNHLHRGVWQRGSDEIAREPLRGLGLQHPAGDEARDRHALLRASHRLDFGAHVGISADADDLDKNASFLHLAHNLLHDLEVFGLRHARRHRRHELEALRGLCPGPGDGGLEELGIHLRFPRFPGLGFGLGLHLRLRGCCSLSSGGPS